MTDADRQRPITITIRVNAEERAHYDQLIATLGAGTAREKVLAALEYAVGTGGLNVPHVDDSKED